jgi:4,5-dihydroxyphthalate decarboxylase
MGSMKALLGDHAVTKHFKETAPLDFANVSVAHPHFKRVVRDLEFDFAELALVTFLLAKAHGKPLRLLPAVVMTRFQHPFLVSTKSLRPKDLEGKRVGERSHSVTTATWVRGMLEQDYGVDPDRIDWVSFEEPHVAEFVDPPNVRRAPAGKEITQMLLSGELDAAIVGERPPDGPLKPVIADPDAAAEAWRRKYGAIQINHMVAVKNTVSREQSDEIYSRLLESRRVAGSPETHPFGIGENRRNLEVAIDSVYRQKMIPRRYAVEALFE